MLAIRNPSRSHFHSIDVWETASTRNDAVQGWLSHVLPHRPNAVNGIVLGDNNLGPMAGANSSAVAMEDPETFLRQTKYLNKSSYRTAKFITGAHVKRAKSNQYCGQ